MLRKREYSISLKTSKKKKSEVVKPEVSYSVDDLNIRFVWPDPVGKNQAALVDKDGSHIFSFGYRCGPSCNNPEFWKNKFSELGIRLNEMSKVEFQDYLSFHVSGVVADNLVKRKK